MDFGKLFETYGQKKTYQRFDRIYEMGDKSQGIYCMRKGLVGLVRVSKSGSEQLLRFFKPGDFFGHRAILAEEKRHATATALEETDVIFVSEKHLLRELRESPEMCQRVIKTLAVELGRAEEWRVQLTDLAVDARVSEALIYLQQMKPDHIWTRTEIANFCATTTPTVIKVLKRLESKKLIQQNGRKINILDRDRLLSLHENTGL